MRLQACNVGYRVPQNGMMVFKADDSSTVEERGLQNQIRDARWNHAGGG